MALPELYMNSPVPGTQVPLTTLAAPVSTTPAALTVETWTFTAAPPAALAQAGQFRILVDSEICLDITGGGGTSRQIQRGVELQTGAITTHANGANVAHILTAAGLANLPISNGSSPLIPVAVSNSNSPFTLNAGYYAEVDLSGGNVVLNQAAPPWNDAQYAWKIVNLGSTPGTLTVNAPSGYTFDTAAGSSSDTPPVVLNDGKIHQALTATSVMLSIAGVQSRSQSDQRYELVAENINTVASSGSGTVTLAAPSTATINRITLTGTPTIDPPTAKAGLSCTMELIQDGTGTRIPTLSAFDWGAAGTPTLSTASGKRDVFAVWCTDGSTWQAAIAGLGF